MVADRYDDDADGSGCGVCGKIHLRDVVILKAFDLPQTEGPMDSSKAAE